MTTGRTRQKKMLITTCAQYWRMPTVPFYWDFASEVNKLIFFYITTVNFFALNPAEPHSASQHSQKHLFCFHGLLNVSRRIHTVNAYNTIGPTRKKNQKQISIARLDHFCCFKHHNVLKGCKMIPAVFTDDSLVFHVFSKSIWKLILTNFR